MRRERLTSEALQRSARSPRELAQPQRSFGRPAGTANEGAPDHPGVQARQQPSKPQAPTAQGVPAQTAGTPPQASAQPKAQRPLPGPATGGYSPVPRTIADIKPNQTKGWSPRG
jgi:hypothetical protein